MNPLELATMEELRLEIERRCRSVVIAYTTDDENGAGYAVGMNGTTLEKYALAGRLMKAAKRMADDMEASQDNEP